MRTSLVLVILFTLSITMHPAHSDADLPMFPDSCAKSATPWTITEESDTLPEAIFSAYIGSGKIGIGLDASGMQNLDCKIGMEKRYTGVSFEAKDDLYVLAEGMVSGHYYPVNLMPLGYLNYSVSIDGTVVPLADSVTQWKRVIDIRRAVVQTTLTLKQGVRLAITAFSPQETHQAYYRFQVQSTDGESRAVVIRPQVSLELRPRNGGDAILDRITRRSEGKDAASIAGEVRKDGKYSPLEDYALVYTVHGPNAWTSDRAIGAQLVLQAKRKPASRTVVFGMGKEERVKPYSKALRDHEADWAGFHNSGAVISIGDPVREFLFNNSLYLLRIGGTYRNGLPLEFLLFHPENWHACTFWDLSFIVDALIKTNHLKQPKRAVEWLNRVAAPEGRTFHWMTLYNGQSGMPTNSVDSGLGVNAAHAMSAIRYYETTGDQAFLRSTVYPLLRKTSLYIAAERFTSEGSSYIGTGSGIDANIVLLVNDTWSTVWFGVILRKTSEYARLLGVDEVDRRKWDDIADNILLSTCERGYKYSRDWPYPDGWVWMLLYPTEAMPLLNMKVYAKNREFLNYENLGQPWVYFWQASSDFRTGLDLADSCEKYISRGIEYTRGPGYFMEGVQGGAMEGLPPYTSAHASYVTASTEQLVIGSIWDDKIGVFTNLPASMRIRNIGFHRIRTSRGVVVSGSFSATKTVVVIAGSRLTQMSIRIPEGLLTAGIVVTLDGRPADYRRNGSTASLSLDLEDGRRATVVIRAK